MQLKYTCPDKLVKTNNNYRLYTKNKYINLSSLDEYSNIIKLQQKNKMNCPILELNTHSNLNSSSLQPTKDENTQLLLDANRSTDVYNYNLYPSYDPMNLYIGLNTPLDEIDKLNIIDGKSANPMDTEWGGNAFTSKLVNSGFYNDNMGKHLDPKILLN
tara:strand:+ start:4446 stop:4922 length:477 start_codon:yes stop_codon:yes gene_type:complete